MTAISLKNVPNEVHRAIKILQMDYADKGEKKTLEEIYIEILSLGLEAQKKSNEK